jgi:hypothetical protein
MECESLGDTILAERVCACRRSCGSRERHSEKVSLRFAASHELEKLAGKYSISKTG